MGMYDIYNDVQIKINATGKSYSIGDSSPLADGIYLGYEGAIIIRDGMFIARFISRDIQTKYGDIIDLNKLISSYIYFSF